MTQINSFWGQAPKGVDTEKESALHNINIKLVKHNRYI